MKENIFKCKACPNIVSSCDPLSEYFLELQIIGTSS